MVEQEQTSGKSYRLSRRGRRTAYLLLAGSLLIWLFALWTLKNTLKIGLRPQTFLPSLQALWGRLSGTTGAMTAEELIPSIIMLALVLVVPLLIWNIIEELRASYTVGPAGITFRSLGIELFYPWSEVVSLRPVDEEAEEEPLDELLLKSSRLSSIRNPLLRFLHVQAYGRRRLPLYGGLEEREELLERIRTYLVAGEEAKAESVKAAGPSGAESGTP